MGPKKWPLKHKLVGMPCKQITMHGQNGPITEVKLRKLVHFSGQKLFYEVDRGLCCDEPHYKP